MRSKVTTTMVVEGAGPRNEDRAAVIEHHSQTILVVADGAGGMSGGAEAAEMVLRMLRNKLTPSAIAINKHFWGKTLKEIDISLERDRNAGEAAAVVVCVSPAGLAGASVGDSGALLVTQNACTDLTSKQRRKPLLGSGMAIPVSFDCQRSEGRLLVATDGLLKYARRDNICSVAREGNLEATARNLVDLVRLRSGKLQDDVALILCQL